ncbi:hypothetical protein AN958_04871 [Leucoagaricus sp. SymC.cos]|nr:hypothetical protein AN958_04871 [Leucoagaricus sp. SymC.cos]
MSAEQPKLNVLMCGTGEYTTGWTGAGASKSDKKIGVVGLTLFDLRRRGKVDKLGMVGVNGKKFPDIRQHLIQNIGNVYRDMDLQFDEFPKDGKVDPEAYKEAIDKLKPGDAVIIFTPDSTHYKIAIYAIERGIHVLVTKPATQLLSHHNELIAAAEKHKVVCFVEHHKRFDPVYSDAKARAQTLGEFNFFSAWMSQPKSQLETFRAWAGKDSDISVYFSCCWPSTQFHLNRAGRKIPTGTRLRKSQNCTIRHDAPTHLPSDTPKAGQQGKAWYNPFYWTAPLKAGIHTGQHWYYMAEKASPGYDVTVDDTGKAWYNPFYMKYSPSETGHFDGQRGYGYVSIEKFIDAVRSVNAGEIAAPEFDKHGFPTIRNTVLTTAILNAGRISLDEKRPVGIKKSGDQWVLE